MSKWLKISELNNLQTEINEKIGMEEDAFYLSQRGIMKSSEFGELTYPSSVYGSININTNLNEMVDGSILFVSQQQFGIHLLDKIPCKVIIIIGDDDHMFPYVHFKLEENDVDCHNLYKLYGSHIFARTDHLEQTSLLYNKVNFTRFIESEKILHCFIENCAITHDKITKIPIGINYHSFFFDHGFTISKQDNEIKMIVENAIPLENRLIKCYGYFHHTIDPNGAIFTYDRRDALAQIPSELIDYEKHYLYKYDSYKKQTDYVFIVSPHGNGLDCHRTWESILLGCIPIVKTSVIDILYDDLPVLIVNEWSDITQELLNNTLKLFSEKTFNYGKITLKYWLEQIYGLRDLKRKDFEQS